MYKYRISKYDPQYRDDNGIYLKEDWISYADIGKVYNGREFNKNDYINTEKKYYNTILKILRINHVNEMIIDNVELNFSIKEIKQMLQGSGLDLSLQDETLIKSLKSGMKISIQYLPMYIKLILRECFWGIFRNCSSTIYIEFGYDYYMYLKCGDFLSKEFIANCKQEGIFIEEM